MKRIVLFIAIKIVSFNSFAMDFQKNDHQEKHIDEENENYYYYCEDTNKNPNGSCKYDYVEVEARDVDVQVENNGVVGQKSDVMVELFKNATINGTITIRNIIINSGCNTDSFKKHKDK